MTNQDFELKMKRMIANLQFARNKRANEKESFKDKKDSELDLCYKCGNPGHYANRCLNKNPKSSKLRTLGNALNNTQHAEWRNHAPNIECLCLDCESEDLTVVPKKRMLVKCTKCCEFKPCSKFGFR